MPRPGRGGPAPKIEDFKGTVKKLLKYLSKYKISIISVFIIASLSTIFSIAGPKILGNATQELYIGIVNKLSGIGGIDFTKIAKILLFLLALYLFSAALNYIQNFIMSGVSQKATYKLRKEVSEKLKRLPMSYYDKTTKGDLLSIVSNDIDTIQMNLNQSATQLVTSIVTIIGIFIMMCSINITLALITTIILPISSIIVVNIVKHSQKYFKAGQDYLGLVDGEVEEMLSGYTVVKAFNAEEKMISKFNEDNQKLYEAGWKSTFASGLMQPIMSFISNISYVIIAIVGALFAIKGKITVGNIQSFIQYSKNFSNPITQLAQVSNNIQLMIASCERVFNLLAEAEDDDEGTLKVDYDKVKGNVEFKNVEFGYTKEKIIINNFNAKISAGKKIAIVGPTGAGKTTIVKLLMRFYNLNSGNILIDGIDIKDYKRSDLRRIFGMVLQDTWLFNGTIMDNLRYGNLKASDEEVKDAAKKANIHHFIKTLPDGYNMILNEETSNISSGQKQLLTIARAILANPKIMILDEATSNVDTRTEVLIQKAMDELMKGKTSFIIAHRLSTIKNADLILVMDNGDIVEQGTHEQLLKKGKFYANIYNSQFEKISE